MPANSPILEPLASDMLRAYSLPDVAERLDVSLMTVRRMIDTGDLKILRPRRHGRTVRVSEQSLRKLFLDAA